jgi:hypothetical protein
VSYGYTFNPNDTLADYFFDDPVNLAANSTGGGGFNDQSLLVTNSTFNDTLTLPTPSQLSKMSNADLLRAQAQTQQLNNQIAQEPGTSNRLQIIVYF